MAREKQTPPRGSTITAHNATPYVCGAYDWICIFCESLSVHPGGERPGVATHTHARVRARSRANPPQAETLPNPTTRHTTSRPQRRVRFVHVRLSSRQISHFSLGNALTQLVATLATTRCRAHDPKKSTTPPGRPRRNQGTRDAAGIHASELEGIVAPSRNGAQFDISRSKREWNLGKSAATGNPTRMPTERALASAERPLRVCCSISPRRRSRAPRLSPPEGPIGECQCAR